MITQLLLCALLTLPVGEKLTYKVGIPGTQ
jgi:hypothetical protein